MEQSKSSPEFDSKAIGHFLENNAIILLMVLVAVFVGIARPTFVSFANIRNLAMNTSVRFVIALGVSGCLITKGTDLSAGRVVGLAACLSATLLQKADYSAKVLKNVGELNILLVLGAVVFICAFVGFLNGAVISWLKVPPFLSSLGMQTLVYGICLVLTGAQPIGGLRSNYTHISSGQLKDMVGAIIGKPLTGFFASVLSIPYLFLIALGLGLFMWFLYNKTKHGKYMYAIGGNENAAEVSGVNTSKTKILIYMLAASLYAVAGFLLAAKAGGASVNTGMGYELEAIAACTIGGVSTNGGVGRVSGILIGVLLFELLKISLLFMGVETSYTYIVQGLVIIIAVALDLRKYLAKR